MLAPYAGQDRGGNKCEVAKWLAPDEGHLNRKSSPFVMWLADQLARAARAR